MNKNDKRMIMYLIVAVILFMFFQTGCAQKVMRYSPIEIRTKSEKGLSDLQYTADCLAGSGQEGESSHSQGLGPRGACGLHGMVRDHHDYEILGGIGME